MAKDYYKMFNSIEEYLKDKVEGIDNTILQAVEDRKNGRKFSFSEHIEGMILSLLSGQNEWKKIYQNKKYLGDLFFHYDKEKIKNCNPQIFIDGIYQKNIGTTSTKAQMHALKYNILIFERIETEYGSLDSFITHDTPIKIVKLLADNGSKYKLVQLGPPLVCEYLRNVGIDIIKPDRHIKRILASNKLNFISSQNDYEVIKKSKQLSDEIGISQVKIDYLLWNYCANGYGKICTKTNPKCKQCVIREFCNNPATKSNNKEADKKIIIVKKAVNSVKKDKKININKRTVNEQNSQIIQEIEQFLSSMPLNHEFSRKWFKTELSKQYKRSEDSYIPSDYCYNRTNNGIIYDKQPHYFLHIGRGKYRYVGKNYQYKGNIEHYPKNK